MPATSRLAVLLPAALVVLALGEATAGAATISSTTPTPLADNFADDGECSLREMVQIANVDSAAAENACTVDGTLGSDTIQLSAGTYTLGGAANEDVNASGDLDIADPDGTVLVGTGTAASIIDAGDNDRVIQANGGPLTLQQLTVQGGRSTSISGGGILATVSVTLNQARITGNETVTTGNGGGISISGATNALSLVDSSVDSNASAGAGGGVNLAGASLTASGDSHLDDNAASSQGGAINISVGGPADVNLGPGVTASGNDALVLGGAIANTGGDPNSDLTVDGAALSNNDVVDLPAGGIARGGAVHYSGNGQVELNDAKIQNNTTHGTSAGGGGLSIAVGTGSLEITRSLITGNHATVDDDAIAVTQTGGGVGLASGAATIADSRIGLNTLTVNDPQDHGAGGGLFSNANLTVDSSTIDNNLIDGTPTSSQGGGVAVITPSGPTGVVNSTISDNDAGTTGGGAYLSAPLAQPATVAHSTFSGNQATTGAALTLVNAAMGTFAIRGSIFANGATACVPNTLDSISPVNGHNVDEGTSCVGVTNDSDLENTTALLGPLNEPNGGPLYGGAGPAQTHELLGPVSALGLVPAADCDDLGGNPLTVDQRDAPRPSGGGCEPGSFEVFSCEGASAYVGSVGGDVIDAASFPAKESFHGLGGGDTLIGDGDANQLCGGDGDDTITGGGASDSIAGDGDNDSIFARDGVADAISCGAGDDTVQTDLQGVDTIAADCETVDLAAPPATQPPATQPPVQPGENPDCERLRQKIKRLSRKIKRTESASKKSKLKKQRKKTRKRLRALGCA